MGSQAAKGPKSPVGKAPVLAPVSGEIPVIMPEKLPVTKVHPQYNAFTHDSTFHPYFSGHP